MKILDILEQIQSTYDKRTSNYFFDPVKDSMIAGRLNPESNNPKHGAFGRVYSSGDPHIINKIAHGPAEARTDGYMQYIKFLIDSNIAAGNPFAPRVYNMKELEDKSGLSKYKVKMETLHSIKEVDPELIEALAKQLFYADDLTRAAKRLGRKTWEGEEKIGMILATAIDITVNGIIESRNEKLNELCSAIAKIAEENRTLESDIHWGNIMIRYGKPPQIVIVDPLS